MTALVVRGRAEQLPLADATVDLIVTSPPYFGLRSYTDGGQHYAGQIGSEPTPAEWLESMLACTAEWIRVLKPAGSIWVNLGDKYSDRAGPEWVGSSDRFTHRPPKPRRPSSTSMAPRKSLLGMPWRYAIGCMDQLGLILREELIWEKPTALPESVTDRARRTHEQWFHLVKQGRYYAAIDAIRQPHTGGAHNAGRRAAVTDWQSGNGASHRTGRTDPDLFNPLGKLPNSVWSICSEPLVVPTWLAVEHFAAFPTEWPRRLITGFSPPAICTACHQGLRPVTTVEQIPNGKTNSGRAKRQRNDQLGHDRGFNAAGYPHTTAVRELLAWHCACPPDDDAPTRPAVVLDPFGGTGTTALCATVLGRIGITVDLSHDYSRIATWRTTDPAQRARAAHVDKPPVEADGQAALFSP